MSETIKIVALCVAAAVLYGVIHDQITARVCVEYFTIGHPRQKPKRTARSLGGVIGQLLLVMAVLAGITGATAWILADAGWVMLLEPWATRVPSERQPAFLAVGAAHGMSYLAGGLGGAMQAWRVWRSRSKTGRHDE